MDGQSLVIRKEDNADRMIADIGLREEKIV
jgi:hypothetical protein